MQKIGNITSTSDANGEWTNGNVAEGTPPTLIDATWLNTIQRELINILTVAGLSIDPTKDNQVMTALSNYLLNVKNNLSEIKTVGAAAQTSARSNLGLGSASTATIGTGANQVPDMNSFTRGSGYFKLPNGIIVQYMQGTTNTSAAQKILYPINFPTAALCVVASAIDVNAPNYMAANVYTTSACLVSAYTNSGTVRAATGAYIIAIGI